MKIILQLLVYSLIFAPFSLSSNEVDYENEAYPLIIECQASALDGAFGIGRSRSKRSAFKTALYYCRAYSRAPRTCRVRRCFSF